MISSLLACLSTLAILTIKRNNPLCFYAAQGAKASINTIAVIDNTWRG
jgi:hypothetical protein